MLVPRNVTRSLPLSFTPLHQRKHVLVFYAAQTIEKGEQMSEPICLCYESALEAWRTSRKRVSLANPATATKPSLLIRLLFEGGKDVDSSALPRPTRVTKIPTKIDVAVIEEFREGEPLLAVAPHLAISRRSSRRYIRGAACHLVSGSYPTGSFCRISELALVSSPELTFMQMARMLEFEELVAYGFELCGYYSRTSDNMGFCSCPPVTSVAAIQKYLERLERIRSRRGEGMPWGFAPALKALAYVRDGAASPEEAITTMVLTLPRMVGGYELPAPRLNERVLLGARAARTFGIDSFVCDLSWNGGAQVLEYHGSQHKLRSRRTYDMRKGNVLGSDGRSVIVMDRTILSRQGPMDEIAKSLSLALGVPWRDPTPGIATKQLKLRNRLVRYLDER